MEGMNGTATIEIDDEAPAQPGTTIRGFRCPDDLWAEAKAKAARRSRPGRRETLTDVLVRAVEVYVNEADDGE